MSLLLEALRCEVEESRGKDFRDSDYPDYTDDYRHSDDGSWSDSWNDGPNHSDVWSDLGDR